MTPKFQSLNWALAHFVKTFEVCLWLDNKLNSAQMVRVVLESIEMLLKIADLLFSPFYMPKGSYYVIPLVICPFACNFFCVQLLL